MAMTTSNSISVNASRASRGMDGFELIAGSLGFNVSKPCQAGGSLSTRWSPCLSPRARVIRSAEIAVKSQTKIIEGCWVWHMNRNLTGTRNTWHTLRGKRGVNFLHGDGHAEFFTMPDAAQG